jgi:hypothetical protein
MSQTVQSDARARVQDAARTAARGTDGHGAPGGTAAEVKVPAQRMAAHPTALPGGPEGAAPPRPDGRSEPRRSAPAMKGEQAAMQIALHLLQAAANTPIEPPPVGNTDMHSANPWGTPFDVQDDEEASEDEADRR